MELQGGNRAYRWGVRCFSLRISGSSRTTNGQPIGGRGALLQRRRGPCRTRRQGHLYDRASSTAASTTASAMRSEMRGSQRVVCIMVFCHAVLEEAGVALTWLTRGPRTRSCKKLSESSKATSPSFTMTIRDHEAGFVGSIPRCDKSTGPVVSSTPMASHTTIRNRSAADRNSAMHSGTAWRLLTRGARTNERNIIPPIQLTAARTWRETRMNHMRRHDNRSGGPFSIHILLAVSNQLPAVRPQVWKHPES